MELLGVALVAAIIFGSIDASKVEDNSTPIGERPWRIVCTTCGGLTILAGIAAAI